MSSASSKMPSYHLHVVGKWNQPNFHKLRTCAEFLANEKKNVEATIEGYFETQFEIRLQALVQQFGGAFFQAKPKTTLVYCIEDGSKALYFASEERFFEWAEKRFKYTDSTSMLLYKRSANKCLAEQMAFSHRKYCALNFKFPRGDSERVYFELFHKECPNLCDNFIELIKTEKYNGSVIHRVKPGCFVQGGDISGDKSGVTTTAANGGFIADESFKFKHSGAGFLGACSAGQDKNGSQFYVTLDEMPALDGRFVIFGRVIGGMRAFKKMTKTELSYAGRPMPNKETGKELMIESGVFDVLTKATAKATAKTGTATSADAVAAGGAGADDDKPVVPSPEHIELDTGDASKEEIDAAATKMQATFRGKQARQDMEAKKAKKEAEKAAAPAAEVELDTGDATKEEIDAAATKMQATFRGKKARAKVQQKKADKVHYVSTDNV